jgi:hypothetical protein
MPVKSGDVKEQSTTYSQKQAKKTIASRKKSEEDRAWAAKIKELISQCKDHTIFANKMLDPYYGNTEHSNKRFFLHFQGYYRARRKEYYPSSNPSDKLQQEVVDLEMAYTKALIQRKNAFIVINTQLPHIAKTHTLSQLKKELKLRLKIEDPTLFKTYFFFLKQRLKKLGYKTKSEKIKEPLVVIVEEPMGQVIENTEAVELYITKSIEENKAKKAANLKLQKAWIPTYRANLILSINSAIEKLFEGTLGHSNGLKYTAHNKGLVTSDELNKLLPKSTLWTAFEDATQNRVIAYTQSLDYKNNACVTPKILITKVKSLTQLDLNNNTQQKVVESIRNINLDLDALKETLKHKIYEEYAVDQEVLDMLTQITWDEINMPPQVLIPDSIMTYPNVILKQKEKMEAVDKFKPENIEFMNNSKLQPFLLNFPGVMVTLGSPASLYKDYEDAWFKYFMDEKRLQKTVDLYILKIKDIKKTAKKENLIEQIEKKTDELVQIFEDNYDLNILDPGSHVECQNLLKSWINAIGEENWSKSKYALGYYDKFEVGISTVALAKDLANLKNVAELMQAENNHLGDFKELVDWGGLAESVSNVCTVTGVIAQAVDITKDSVVAIKAIKEGGDTPWYDKVPVVNGFVTLVHEMRDAWNANKQYRAVIERMDLAAVNIGTLVLTEKNKIDLGQGSTEVLNKLEEKAEKIKTRLHNYGRAAKKMIRLFFNKCIDFSSKVFNYLSWTLALIPSGITQAVAGAIGLVNGIMGFCQKGRQLFNNLVKRATGQLGKSRTEAAHNIVGDLYNQSPDDIDDMLNKEAYETLEKSGILGNKVVTELLTHQMEANSLYVNDDTTPNEPKSIDHPLPCGNIAEFKACMLFLIGNMDFDTAKFLLVRAYMEEHLRQALKSN